MNRWLRSFLGILTTILAFSAVSTAFFAVPGFEHPSETVGEWVASAGFAVLAALGAGYLAAAAAGWRETVHGAVGGFLLGWGAGTFHFDFADIPSELTRVVALLALLPAGTLGGRLRGVVQARRREVRRLAGLDRPLSLPFVVQPLRHLTWLGAFLSLGMAAGGAVAAKLEPKAEAGWAALALFGAGALFLFYRAFFPRPHLTLDEHGIDDHRLGVRFPWTDIRGASIKRFIFLDWVLWKVGDPNRYLNEISVWKRQLMTGNREVGGSDFAITMVGTGVTPEALCELINTEAARRGGAGSVAPAELPLTEAR
jgi:hypothetical protein